MANNRKGKPYKFTREVQDKFIELVTDGMKQSKACKALGVEEQTVILHKKNNLEFLERFKEANIKTDKLAHKSVKAGMVKDWRAGAWWLERTNPDFKEKSELTVNLVQDAFKPDELAKRDEPDPKADESSPVDSEL